MAIAQHARPIPGAVATAGVNERLTFIRKTYAHLAGAIFAFVLLEYFFLNSQLGEDWVRWTFNGSWLLVLGLFMVVGWVADRWAHSATSRKIQYVGLSLYVVAEVVLFAPLLYIAKYYVADPYIIHKAATITLILFAGLTGTVFLTKKDFSFLRSALSMGGIVALGMIVVSLIWGLHLGTWFSGAMILLASGYVLFTTSRVLAHYRPTQYVAASLTLFAAIALMFWYVLRLLIQLQSD